MKTFVGLVVRTKNAKTAHVEIHTEWMHPKYLKKVRQSRVFACQDDMGVKVGDEVEIAECKQLSATKYFKVVKMIREKAIHKIDIASVEVETTDEVASPAIKKTEKASKKTSKKATSNS